MTGTIMTTNEVCDKLDITARTLYKYAQRGLIKKYKLAATMNAYMSNDVERLQNELRRGNGGNDRRYSSSIGFSVETK